MVLCSFHVFLIPEDLNQQASFSFLYSRPPLSSFAFDVPYKESFSSFLKACVVHFFSITEGKAAVLLKSSLSPSNKAVAFQFEAGTLNEQREPDK